MTIVGSLTDDEEVLAAAVLHDTVEDRVGEFGFILVRAVGGIVVFPVFLDSGNKVIDKRFDLTVAVLIHQLFGSLAHLGASCVVRRRDDEAQRGRRDRR